MLTAVIPDDIAAVLIRSRTASSTCSGVSCSAAPAESKLPREQMLSPNRVFTFAMSGGDLPGIFNGQDAIFQATMQAMARGEIGATWE